LRTTSRVPFSKKGGEGIGSYEKESRSEKENRRRKTKSEGRNEKEVI